MAQKKQEFYFGRLINLDALTEADINKIRNLKHPHGRLEFPAAGFSIGDNGDMMPWEDKQVKGRRGISIRYFPEYFHYEAPEQHRIRDMAERLSADYNLPLYDVWAKMERITNPITTNDGVRCLHWNVRCYSDPVEVSNEENNELIEFVKGLFPVMRHWFSGSGLTFIIAAPGEEVPVEKPVVEVKPVKVAQTPEPEPEVVAQYKSTPEGREILQYIRDTVGIRIWTGLPEEERKAILQPFEDLKEYERTKAQIDEEFSKPYPVNKSNDIDAALETMRNIQNTEPEPEEERPPRTGRPIKTAIIVDEGYINTTPREEEIAMHVRHFEEYLDRPLDYCTPTFFIEDEIPVGTELILFDYGGMSIGNDMLEGQSRRLVQYAIDHPSTLIVIVSTFCWNRAVQYDMEDLGHKNGLPNLVLWDVNDPVPDWFKDQIKEK